MSYLGENEVFNDDRQSSQIDIHIEREPDIFEIKRAIFSFLARTLISAPNYGVSVPYLYNEFCQYYSIRSDSSMQTSKRRFYKLLREYLTSSSDAVEGRWELKKLHKAYALSNVKYEPVEEILLDSINDLESSWPIEISQIKEGGFARK